MQVVVDRRSGSRVALTVTVDADVVKAHAEQRFQKYARRVTVPGFRPGKAPRRLVEEYVDYSRIMQDAIEDVINSTYREALREQQMEAIEVGDIEDVQTHEDMSVTYTVSVSVRPEVTFPALTDLSIDYTSTKVTDDQVDAEIERLRDRGADMIEVQDAIEQGDYVIIDYTMTLNGEPYPDGDANGYPLEVGADTLFPELNEGLLGYKTGDTTTISITYPDDFGNAELAGKTAEFTVVIQKVQRRQKPEITPAWVELLSNGSLHTEEELRDAIRQSLVQMATRMDRDHIREELMRQLVEKSQLEIPDVLVEHEHERLMADLEHRLSHEHMTMEEYAEETGQTVANIESEQQLLARDIVRRSLILQEVARKDDIDISDAEIEALVILDAASRGEDQQRVRKRIKQYRKEMESSGRLDRMVSRLFHEKVLSHLEKHAQIQVDGQPFNVAEQPEESEPEANEAE